jgi:hypothetical protein
MLPALLCDVQQLLFELLVHLVDLLDHTLPLHRFSPVDSGGMALVGCNPGIHDVLSASFADFLLLW